MARQQVRTVSKVETWMKRRDELVAEDGEGIRQLVVTVLQSPGLGAWVSNG